MTDTTIASIIGGVVAIILLWMQNKQAIRIAKLTASQKETHELVNSRMTELLELTRTSSKAEGKKEEKEETNSKNGE